MVLLTAILFIGMLLVLVLVHEWGHFIAARKAGCNVEEFGFGFPPRLFSIKRGATVYSFNMLPIGGFVRIEGENMDEATPSTTSFATKSAFKRIVILSAGVFMNIVLAAVLFAIQSGIGSPTIVTEENVQTLTDPHTYILSVGPNTPASSAGIEAYDRIVRVNEAQNPSITQTQDLIKEQAGKELTVELERQGQHLTKTITPRINPPEGEGALGVSLAATGLQKTPWLLAPWEGIKKTGQMLVAILEQFFTLIKKLVTEGSTGQALTGPIGIAVYTGEVSRLGLGYFLEFAAMISLNLAIINILPFPALDGGRIIFVLLEVLFRKRISGNIEAIVHTAGFALLILAMVLVTFKDIQRYF